VGGDLGYHRQDQFAPAVGGVAFAIEPGQVAPNPIRGDQGWFVIKADQRRRVDPPSFAQVREKLRHDVMLNEVVNAAREIVANAGVHKFNLDGSPMGVATPEQAPDQGDSKP
jgi:peptidyl-prolyl cis-trans isomerase C